MASHAVHPSARRLVAVSNGWISEHVAGDQVDDGFEVSFGSVAFGLALGGLDIAVDRLEDAIGKAGGDGSEDAFRLGRDRLGQLLQTTLRRAMSTNRLM